MARPLAGARCRRSAPPASGLRARRVRVVPRRAQSVGLLPRPPRGRRRSGTRRRLRARSSRADRHPRARLRRGGGRVRRMVGARPAVARRGALRHRVGRLRVRHRPALAARHVRQPRLLADGLSARGAGGVAGRSMGGEPRAHAVARPARGRDRPPAREAGADARRGVGARDAGRLRLRVLADRPAARRADPPGPSRRLGPPRQRASRRARGRAATDAGLPRGDASGGRGCGRPPAAGEARRAGGRRRGRGRPRARGRGGTRRRPRRRGLRAPRRARREERRERVPAGGARAPRLREAVPASGLRVLPRSRDRPPRRGPPRGPARRRDLQGHGLPGPRTGVRGRWGRRSPRPGVGLRRRRLAARPHGDDAGDRERVRRRPGREAGAADGGRRPRRRGRGAVEPRRAVRTHGRRAARPPHAYALRTNRRLARLDVRPRRDRAPREPPACEAADGRALAGAPPPGGYSFVQSGTRPGVHGAPAFSIAASSARRSVSTRPRSFASCGWNAAAAAS